MEDITRKVLITYGMSSDRMLLLTDAPKEEIEKWCRKYNEEMENGNNIYLGDLKRNWYTKVIVDSELHDFDMDDIEIIGYDENYDLSDYYMED